LIFTEPGEEDIIKKFYQGFKRQKYSENDVEKS
jgi:hypothetical protein